MLNNVSRGPLKEVGCVSVVLAMLVISGTSARAQSERSVPTIAYHAAFTDFYDGEYKDALAEFMAEGRGAIQTPQSRWIDSICYETMVAECYYEMGHLQQALDHYTAAIKLYTAFSDWMIRVKFPPNIQVSAARTRIPWGNSTRQARLGRYPTTMLIGQGKIDQRAVVEHGGVVQQAILYPVQVQEIVRCTTLAIRRRARLLGPVSQHDPITSNLIAALSRRPGPPNHWSEAWVNIQLGLALIAGGKQAQGIPYLQRSVVAAGEFDHPMTSIALLELGRLALQRGDFPTALKFFQESTYAAVAYPDGGVLEEAFRYAAMTHMVSNGKGVYPPLPSAIQWAKVKNLRHLHASLLLSAAENYAVAGQTADAHSLIAEAGLVIGRRSMIAGRVGARLNYLTALVLFQQKKIAEGDAALAAAMVYMKQGSHWLFHISQVDNRYVGGSITARAAGDLYANVLRDPGAADWASGPMESLTVLNTPHPGPLERWFEVVLEKRKDHETALEIGDRIRRHRFFSSLAFGGRLQSLRWILEGPAEELGQQSQLQRQDLLARYPVYAQLSQQARALRARLAEMPLVAPDQESMRAQSKNLDELASIGMHQEAILREMSVRREAAELVFPPLRPTADIRKSLPAGHAVLAFVATRRRLYAFLMNNKQYTHWAVSSPTALKTRMTAMLREMGHFQANHELSLDDLADSGWKQLAHQVLKEIEKGSRADFSQPLEELAIVPDGMLWYLPFEALQVEVDGMLRPMIARFRVRYAPTLSLTAAGQRGRGPTGNTAVVLGQLFPRDDASVARTAFAQLGQAVPGAVELPATLPAPSSVYGTLFDRLIVLDDLKLDDLKPGDGDPYSWTPVPIDAGKPGSSLGDWLSLPFGGPDEIILPGYHTAAEDSLKRLGAMPGNEVFLSVCALMSGGARTVLLSRWRTGGQSSFDLVREFAQELPHTSPSDAWQRAVFLVAGSRLDLDAEPRVKRTLTDATPRTTHPFFWAGYMLVAPGTRPQQPEPEPEEPVIKIE